MQAFMTRHNDRHVIMTCTFYTLALSNFENYFCNSTTCIKGLVLLENYLNILIITTLPKIFTHFNTYISNAIFG
jgi:hypothetical protein